MILCDADFLETHQSSTTSCADLLHRISLKSNNKYREYGYNFRNVHKQSITITAPVF